MPTVKSATKGRVVGDLIKHEYDQRYTRVSRGLINDSLTPSLEIANYIGYPVRLLAGTGTGTGYKTEYALCKAGEESACVGLVVGGTEKTIPAMNRWVESEEYALLIRGPAVISQDGLAAADWAGSALNKDTISAALAALAVPIVTMPMPTKKSTQTT